MYIEYVFNWLYKIMLLPFPLVLSNEVFYLVTILDLFMFSVYVAIFIILIRYILTDTISFEIGGYSINYSSSAYLPSHILSNRNKKREIKERIKKERTRKFKNEKQQRDLKEAKVKNLIKRRLNDYGSK
ncbi:MAG: hypothetical protein IKV94_03540 [Clostridia bacterium]|nr:hypothetical protein [Clostridia bacterium]